jgi:F0F1-type ATP synthase alpha subunit
MIPLIGVSITERLRDKGYDCLICFDDLSKHSKSYRQISLILAKIPSRDAFPADIFNIHSSLLERCGKMNYCYFGGGSISGIPIIETINSDITEYIATNVISITDGQFYTSKRLFIDSCRPAIDSGLSVSRIGSNAQCYLIKGYSIGLKNLITNYRSGSLVVNSTMLSLNLSFYQDHLLVSAIEISLLLLILFRNGLLLKSHYDYHKLLCIISYDVIYLSYLI